MQKIVASSRVFDRRICRHRQLSAAPPVFAIGHPVKTVATNERSSSSSASSPYSLHRRLFGQTPVGSRSFQLSSASDPFTYSAVAMNSAGRPALSTAKGAVTGVTAC